MNIFSRKILARVAIISLLLIALLAVAGMAIHARTSSQTHVTPLATSTVATPARPAGTATTSPLFQNFVKVCGTQLCLNGQPWEPYFASTYAASHHPAWDISAAVQGHLNTIRINNFLDSTGDPTTAPYDEARWKLVDWMIANARANGLHVILDLSVYRNMTTQNDTRDPYGIDWKPFLTFVINRVNTVSHVRYGDDTTIAMFALAGEVTPPNGSNPEHVTTQHINSFFARTAAEFKALDHHHLLSPGGLYQLGWNSGVDYRTIFATPGLDVCAVHAPPDGGDAQITANYCASIHKPWLWEEFFEPQSAGDQARAQFYQQTYTLGKQLHDAGIGFWNLGPGLGATNDDVGPQTPLTWQTVIRNAPTGSTT